MNWKRETKKQRKRKRTEIKCQKERKIERNEMAERMKQTKNRTNGKKKMAEEKCDEGGERIKKRKRPV